MAGSHITKLALANAMKSIMAQQPFARISVSDISTACGMSRKSFYYHFHDKYELVSWIFEKEFVLPSRARKYASSWEFFYALCTYFYENLPFYVNAFAMHGQNSFAEYFSKFLRPLVSAYFKKLFPEGENNEFFTDFFTDAFLVSVLRWIRSPQPMQPQTYVDKLKEAMAGVAWKAVEET